MVIRSVLIKRLSLVFIVLIFSAKALAHPHSWIELNTTFVIDEDVQLVKVKQRWEFDAYYSMMTRADLLNEFSNEKQGLTETARRMINSLKDYEYFSELKVEGKKLKLGMPLDYSLSTKKKVGSSILVLEMTFNIMDKVKVENEKVSWRVFDPTYYISMNHDKASNVDIISKGTTECSKTLEVPAPSDEIVDYAKSLDKTQKNTRGLGVVAQT